MPIPDGQLSHISLDELSYPLYVPHRGGANILPENTMDAFRGAVELGFTLVEMDAYLLRDGGLMVMHDTTTERTSNLRGRADDHTTPSVLRGRIDAGAWFAAGWPSDLLIPAFTDVLRRFGNHVNLMVEAKNPGSGQAIVDAVVREELAHTVIVQSFMRRELEPALQRGMAALQLEDTGDVDPQALVADGIGYLGVAQDAPEANIKAAREAGLRVFAYTVDRRYVRDRLLGAGVEGFISDDPLYLSGQQPPQASDPFTGQTYWHGCLPSHAGERGVFTPPGSWGYPLDSAQHRDRYRGALQGWHAPADGRPHAGAFTIALNVTFDGERGERPGWAGLFCCAARDRAFDDDGGGRCSVELDGYHALLRTDGVLELHRVDAGHDTLLRWAATPGVEAGGTASLAITVTPAGITVARTDSGDSVEVADETHRGVYWHLGCRRAAIRFSDVAVTPEAGDPEAGDPEAGGAG